MEEWWVRGRGRRERRISVRVSFTDAKRAMGDCRVVDTEEETEEAELRRRPVGSARPELPEPASGLLETAGETDEMRSV